MTIRVVTDSTCDLMAETIQEHKIEVVPCYLNIRGRSYLDGIEYSREQFYRDLPGMETPPTTSAPGPEKFAAVYKKLIAEGASAILSIHVNRQWSNMVNVAQLAAETIPSVPIKVIDSQQLSLSLGFLVQAAAEAANSGGNLSEIVAMLQEKITRTYTVAVLDTLEFLRRSGRATKLQAQLSIWLQLKPFIKIFKGEITLEPIRTRQKALQRLTAWFHEHGPWERLAVVHTGAREYGEELWGRLLDYLPDVRRISVQVTPVIGAHAGPGALGFCGVQA
jgi:DegV family protein with EDD domain